MIRSFGYIPKWFFQTEMPVKYSAYHVILPQYFQYTVQTIKRQPLEQKDTKTKGTWYIMKNIPGLKREPCSRNMTDYQQSIEFQLTKIDAPGYYSEIRNTWAKIINELMESEAFGGVLKKKIKATDDLETQLENVQQVKDKVRSIYNYVQSGMQWNQEYSKYPEDGAMGIKESWHKKTGNTADINFILLKLLQNADIAAKPLLVSTRENGTINAEYPFIRQFNAVFVYVKDGNNRYILNAADKKTPYNFIPEEVLFTNALVVDKDSGGLVGLNSQDNYSHTVVFNASVDNEGKATGDAAITAAGYAKQGLINGDTKNKLKEVLQDWEKNTVTIDTVFIKNATNETLPAIVECKFYKQGEQSGEYYFLPCTLFTNLGNNPFLEENRIADIDFIYPKTYSFTGTYRLPEGMEVSSLPRNARMILPDTSIIFSRMIQQDENIISLKISAEFKGASYTAESYPYIKNFFIKMHEILGEKIVLKKNK